MILSQTESVPCSTKLHLNHYRATPKSPTESPLSKRIHLMLDHGKGRDISFIVSPYLLTRVAYECKFTSLRYRGCNVNRISSRLWRNAPIKTEPTAREKCKRRTSKERCCFRFMPVRLITLKHEHESSVWTCASIRAMRQREILETELLEKVKR